MNKVKNKLLLVSGGVNSTTFLYYMIKKNLTFTPIYIEDGLNVKPIFNFIEEDMGIKVKQYSIGDLPISSFNDLIFMHLALVEKFDEVIICTDMESSHLDEYAIYNSKMFQTYFRLRFGLRISYPFIKKTKENILSLAVANKVPLKYTVSCSCKEGESCPKCELRKKYFIGYNIK